jgi:hypothetical protein
LVLDGFRLEQAGVDKLPRAEGGQQVKLTALLIALALAVTASAQVKPTGVDNHRIEKSPGQQRFDVDNLQLYADILSDSQAYLQHKPPNGAAIVCRLP